MEPDLAGEGGYGYLDAPRGALGHWVQIENGKIARYQCVVPSTWNAGHGPAAKPDPMKPRSPTTTARRSERPSRSSARFTRSIPLRAACNVLDAPGRLVTEVKVQ